MDAPKNDDTRSARNDDCAPYARNRNYGAERVIEKEREYINRDRSGDPSDRHYVGLAISGGGIRSATFSLGILQALARHGWLEKIDYMSTVSGGGYIGSSLTWLFHKDWELEEKDRFDCSAANFPYGTHRIPDSSSKVVCAGVSATDGEEQAEDVDKEAMLPFLRQHGKYLTPGNGITFFSLVAVMMRGTLLSLLVYLPLLALFMVILYGSYVVRHADTYPPSWSYLVHLDVGGNSIPLNISLLVVICLVSLAIIASVLYALSTYSSGRKRISRYGLRRWFETGASRLVITILIFLGLGTLPFVYRSVGEQFATAGGALSAGFIAVVMSFFKTGGLKKADGKPALTLSMLAWMAAILLLYGVLFLSYHIAHTLYNADSLITLWLLLLFVGIALVVGRFVNVNYVSIHRYYRDRLMETFMPNVSDVIRRRGAGLEGATDADSARLSQMCSQNATGPYHILNTTVVLVESKDRKYRSRGGDNFILTPQYCGSSATGWLKTDKFMNDSMTLSTAMAISGAAANPDTGVGGEGPTRSPVMSLLMSLLNIRLGYWAPNPDPSINFAQTNDSAAHTLEWINPLYGYRPNFFVPLLTATALAKVFGQILGAVFSLDMERYFGKTEKNRFIELTDGGHFENLGLYELIRRRLKTIIVCDGGVDAEFQFGDLANAIEKVRVDFGTIISLDLEPLVPDAEQGSEFGIPFAERGFVLGKICYPDDTTGTLIYIRLTLPKDIDPALIGYKKQHKEFPHQTTADQFFDEKQFEAYRELGFFITEQLTETYVLAGDARLYPAFST